MSAQPTLGETKVRTGFLDQAPEAARVILFFQMHQLMQQHVVAHRRRHLHEPIVEGNPSGARARSPPRTLIPNRQSRGSQTVTSGQRMEPAAKLLARKRTQVGLDTDAKVASPVQEDRSLSIANDSPATGIYANLHRHQVSAQHHRGPMCPGGRDAGGVHPCTLGRYPGAMTVEKARRFGARAASRNRDANRAVGPDADYVAPGTAHSNEFDTRRRGNRFDFRAEKRQIELHEEVLPMITQPPGPPTRRP